MNAEFKKIIATGKKLITKLNSDGHSSTEKDNFEDAIKDYEKPDEGRRGMLYWKKNLIQSLKH